MLIEENCFEISAGGNYLRITPIKISDKSPILIVNVKIEVKGGPFSGIVNGVVTDGDFRELTQQLKFIYDRRIREAFFNSLEYHVVIQFKADELGHCTAFCEVTDDTFTGNICKFEISFDQSYIPGYLIQLETIIKAFEG